MISHYTEYIYAPHPFLHKYAPALTFIYTRTNHSASQIQRNTSFYLSQIILFFLSETVSQEFLSKLKLIFYSILAISRRRDRKENLFLHRFNKFTRLSSLYNDVRVYREIMLAKRVDNVRAVAIVLSTLNTKSRTERTRIRRWYRDVKTRREKPHSFEHDIQ